MFVKEAIATNPSQIVQLCRLTFMDYDGKDEKYCEHQRESYAGKIQTTILILRRGPCTLWVFVNLSIQSAANLPGPDHCQTGGKGGMPQICTIQKIRAIFIFWKLVHSNLYF